RDAVADLERLYRSGNSEADMRAAKAARLERLRADYAELKLRWDGYTGYDAWFAGDLNNAQLATVNTYNKLVLAFATLLDNEGGDLLAFYARVQALQRLDKTARHAYLQTLLDSQGPDLSSR